MITYVLAVLTMTMMSFGQVLLKCLAMKLSASHTATASWRNESLSFLSLGASVFAIYLIVLCCWLYVLRALNLNQAFAFVALTFIFVPLLSHFILHEKITIGNIAGSLLIISGIVVSVKY